MTKIKNTTKSLRSDAKYYFAAAVIAASILVPTATIIKDVTK